MHSDSPRTKEAQGGPVKYSRASKALKGQEMFRILARANELERRGHEIIHFELGDPDFDTPENIKRAVSHSLKNGDTHYCDSAGLYELKVAAANSTERGRRGFKPSLEQLLVTPGANIQLYYALACTTDPGDEVVVPDPGFVSYYSIIDYIGAKAVRVPAREENEFRLSPKDVEAAITDKTTMILVNSPSNPLGAVMTEEEIRRIYDIAERHDLWLLSDEIYTRIVYDEARTNFFSPSVIDRCQERTIVVNGFSKTYAMTGWRLGISTAPEELTSKMRLLLETTSSCVQLFLQRAALEALNGSQDSVHEMVAEYQKRRDYIVQKLNNIAGISCVNPKGAFYVFPNIRETGRTSQEFADTMLEEAGVALAPGPVFGEYGEGFVRLSYCNSMENIENGLERMDYALRGGKKAF
jgi:aspartate/methionine/tyrosine aminotransferase